MSDHETRARLLREASRLFAEQGLKKVTVRDICRAARANVAAVNYHFGGKLGLYGAVMQQAIAEMAGTVDAARAAGSGYPPEEQLRRFLVIFLTQILKAEHAIYHRLLLREVQDPTPLLDAVVQQGIRPRLEYLAGVVAEIIGGRSADGHVMQCVGSINAQVIIYMPSPIATRLGYEFKGTRADIEQAAEHIATFSIAGARAVGDHVSRGAAPSSDRAGRGAVRARRRRRARPRS